MSQQYIYGYHSVLAILKKSPQQITEIFLQHGKDDKRQREIIELSKSLQLKINYRDRKELDRYIPDAPHQGIVAACQTQSQYTERDLPVLLDACQQPLLILVLDGIQDPHNLGACLRTADAAGCHMVIAPKDKAVGITPTVRKVACGAAESLPFIQVTNLARTLRMLKERGIWLYGAAGEATQSLYETTFTSDCALVLGAEEKGLRRLTRELCDYLISIPLFGTVSSLNVSVATAVCLFEVVRQRSQSN